MPAELVSEGSLKTYTLPDDSVLNHVVDVHCHPTDTPSISPESLDSLKITICAMSSRQSDQSLVRRLASSHPTRVIPCFGYHPWFSHWISLGPISSKADHYRSLFLSDSGDTRGPLDDIIQSFPDPIPLSDILAEVRQNLEAFPNAMLGEVGVDRAFRIPYDYDASPRRLSPFTVPLDHQLVILEAQIDLAVELGRNVSLHTVKAQLNTQKLLDKLQKKHGDKWYRINIDLHSCGLSPQMWCYIERKHSNMFLSLSTVINSRSPNHISLIQACSPSRILVESDYHDVAFCTEKTWDMLNIIAETKGWHVESTWTDDIAEAEWGAVRRLENNCRTFSGGRHSVPQGKAPRREQ